MRSLESPPPELTLPEPSGLQKIQSLTNSFKPQRPLDPNGVDVYGELPLMQKAYTMGRTLGLARNTGSGEAGYAILPGENGGFSHTPIATSAGLRLNLRVPSNALAIVHTHPPSAHSTPGPEDADSRFPNYVFSGDKLYVTDPKTRAFSQYDIDKWNVEGLGKIAPKSGQ